MNTTNKEKVINYIVANCKCDIDFKYYLGHNDFDTVEDITEILEDNNALDQEVIYYSNAMEYLKENDSSLRESLALAHELGYTADKINSELLASLLKTQNCRNEWNEFTSELEDFINELEETE